MHRGQRQQAAITLRHRERSQEDGENNGFAFWQMDDDDFTAPRRTEYCLMTLDSLLERLAQHPHLCLHKLRRPILGTSAFHTVDTRQGG